MDLSNLRKEIDSLDSKIVSLLNERATVSVQVGRAKAAAVAGTDDPAAVAAVASTAEVYVPRREREVFEQVVRMNHGPLSNEAVVAIYREIMSASISLQQQVAVTFLGPAGTHSHQAAMDRFGDSVLYVPMTTIADVFTAVEQGRAMYGVVPFENSTFGSVAQTLDRFISSPLQIRGETYLPIHHYSCRRRLCMPFDVPHAERISVSSTAQAAELASKEPHAAAIANQVCAQLYGLQIVAPRVEDAQGNTTRFLVLARESDSIASSQPDRDKSLLCFTVDHRVPGALCDALRVFKDCGINLTRIDSRPDRLRNDRGGLWHYVFFRALKELEGLCVDLKVLGSYPVMEGKFSAAPGMTVG
ncbi:hypothetical protein BCR44DRAFT_1478806 [Catenaria anguillulae PL171]|uniref:Bifunctional chorismate mutase/prephenate dehydratase n=1 Tax=Catenaria anguillulae PL171 TaxID=765915 RepID=A0A1Y2I3N6_9FUNG|nr:hypothetical protein BCR44DRAFT_1478806 [Catenaria anguillulae PL171]